MKGFNYGKRRMHKMTREFCNNLLGMLKKQHLDPVLQQLQRKEGAKLSFHEIIEKYNLIKDDYHKSAIGANDEIEEVFFRVSPSKKNSGLHWFSCKSHHAFTVWFLVFIA